MFHFLIAKYPFQIMSTPKLPAINHRQNPSGFQNTPSQNFSERELSKSVSLAAVRAKRKQIDETAHLLNNRVLVLEHEQEKLIKATRDTKEKTSFMLKHRVDREETQVISFHELFLILYSTAKYSRDDSKDERATTAVL